jgi:N-acyl-D-aspartate/D-glutamate deacylase
MERKTITLPFAVRSLTSLPAQILGLRDRGRLVEGSRADVVVLDPERVRDRATYFEPFQYSEGIDQVLVNGALVVDEGRSTGKRPGRVLERQRPQRKGT